MKGMKKFIFWITTILFCFSVSAQEKIDIHKAVSRGDIFRTSCPDSSVLNLYQGNGRFGCSYGPMGLHNNPGSRLDKYGKTQYMHIQHFVRAKYGADYLLPLAYIYWEQDSVEVTGYEQHQSFYDGTITTHFEKGSNKVTVTTWFDPVDRDLAGITIGVKGGAPGVVIDPYRELQVHYGQELSQSATISEEEGMWKVELACMNTRTTFFVRTNADTKKIGNALHVKLHEGENTILISVNHSVKEVPEQSLTRSKDWWHSRWNNSACMALPDAHAQAMWVRSMAYLISSYSDDKLGIAPPMGYTGNGWPFSFPQDLSFIHPVFLYSGDLNIARSWVEYWAERIQGMKDYTKRLFGVEGVLAPWAFLYGDFKGFHDPVPPNHCYYEIHNSGYLAKMAHETAVFVNDSTWTSTYVAPLIRETALFYRNLCKKEQDGLWHLFITPSMGQDENGGENQKDYLDALFSAEYCFQKAIEYKQDADGFYATILKDGLAFPSLKSGKGYYYTNQGSGKENYGQQKHPIQLNELSFLPVSKHVDDPTATAYRLRYDITVNAQKPRFAGWTLCDFLLAGSRIGDAAGWQKDWNNLLKSDYIDPDWIQIYESSCAYAQSFYVTSSGLMAQALLNNVVSDWFGKLEVAKCNPWKGEILFRNIYSLLGVKVSGKINGTHADVTLVAWKDCAFDLRGKKITMKKNEVRTIKLNLGNR